MRQNRTFQELRSVSFKTGVNIHAEGSCLVKFGNTQVLCTASIDEKTPHWLKNSGKGWVTAEYGMLPRSTNTRIDREAAKGKQKQVENEVIQKVEKIRTERKKAKVQEIAKEEKKPQVELKINDKVRLADSKSVGTIDSISKGKATINYGFFTTIAPIEQLEKVGK